MSIRKWKREIIKRFGRDNIIFLTQYVDNKKSWTFWLNPDYDFKDGK